MTSLKKYVFPKNATCVPYVAPKINKRNLTLKEIYKKIKQQEQLFEIFDNWDLDVNYFKDGWKQLTCRKNEYAHLKFKHKNCVLHIGRECLFFEFKTENKYLKKEIYSSCISFKNIKKEKEKEGYLYYYHGCRIHIDNDEKYFFKNGKIKKTKRNIYYWMKELLL